MKDPFDQRAAECVAQSAVLLRTVQGVAQLEHGDGRVRKVQNNVEKLGGTCRSHVRAKTTDDGLTANSAEH